MTKKVPIFGIVSTFPSLANGCAFVESVNMDFEYILSFQRCFADHFSKVAAQYSTYSKLNTRACNNNLTGILSLELGYADHFRVLLKDPVP